jgi:hypothetical protein
MSRPEICTKHRLYDTKFCRNFRKFSPNLAKFFRKCSVISRYFAKFGSTKFARPPYLKIECSLIGFKSQVLFLFIWNTVLEKKTCRIGGGIFIVFLLLPLRLLILSFTKMLTHLQRPKMASLT